jgi:hypothetical protein
MSAWIGFGGSVLTALFSLFGVIYASRKQHSVTVEEVKSEIALVKKDITTLEASVSKHNSVIDRMYKAESDIAVIQEKMKVANNRIEDLERVTEQ